MIVFFYVINAMFTHCSIVICNISVYIIISRIIAYITIFSSVVSRDVIQYFIMIDQNMFQIINSLEFSSV